MLVIVGEVIIKVDVDYKGFVKECLEDIGFDSDEFNIFEKISV